ncbi:hypothetical protein [Streptomyces griseoluteus]
MAARIDPADAPEQDVCLEDGRVNAALLFRRQGWVEAAATQGIAEP